jgi:hypothetical protein
MTLFATPNVNDNTIMNVGFYGQDQWIIKKLTLNLGMRSITSTAGIRRAWGPGHGAGAHATPTG